MWVSRIELRRVGSDPLRALTRLPAVATVVGLSGIGMALVGSEGGREKQCAASVESGLL